MEFLVLVLVAMLANSLFAPLVSIITRDVPAATALFLTTVTFLVVALGVIVATGTWNVSYAVAPSAGFVYVAGFFLAGGILAYFVALELGPVSVVVPIFGMFVVGSAVIGIVFLGEDASLTRLAGIACAIAAISLSASDRS
jgi:transporter family protein